jgi:hypothetical protein
LVPSFHGGDDFVRVLCPAKGPRVEVGFRKEPLDGGLEFDDRAEHAAQQAPFGEFCEIALDGIQPGGGRRGEVERPARVACSTLARNL